ncbi:MAG: outer membrane beta-barrel protein [Dysgonomonas sp.]|nr:outer membrane beta-barrel protein [Dysgonomonas sp.]
MKKTLIVALICFLASFHSVNAQNRAGAFSLSGNLSYGTDIESLGVALRAQYGFTQYLRGMAEYKYYIDRHNWSAWGVNADGHYVFSVSRAVQLYPLAGISLSRWTYDTGRSKIHGIQNYKHTENRIGLNAGFGIEVGLADNTYMQIEAKEALIKDHSQFVISLGFVYQF